MQSGSHNSIRVKLLLRVIFCVIALFCAYYGGAGASFYFRLRRANQSPVLLHLPLLSPAVATDRLLIVAPHCDDEMLGCGGLIQQTLKAGGKVETIIVTNGDGYPAAVQRQQRVLKAGPQDFIRFAAQRQLESKSSLSKLGAGSAIFLGFPDRGTMEMWDNNWTSDHPYTSAYTGYSHSPYAETFNIHSHYSGSDLLQDLCTAITAFRPTRIVVTHPSEDHTDHAAVASFVQVAVASLRSDPEQQTWARNIEIYHYLIHRGDWPVPQGDYKTASLLPPLAMTGLDTEWYSLPLSNEEVQLKAHAIDLYSSQTAIMPGFMASFSRANELYGLIEDRALDQSPIDPGMDSWISASPAILDPARDNLLRDLQGGADILSIYCRKVADRLEVRLTARCPIDARYRYSLHVRPFDSKWRSPEHLVEIDMKPGPEHRSVEGIVSRSFDRTLDVSVPWQMIESTTEAQSIRALAVSAITSLATMPVEIDRTQTRLLALHGASLADNAVAQHIGKEH